MINPMKKLIMYLMLVCVTLSSTMFISSCKKGEDDPAISLRTREDRFTNTWTLTRYERNGADQDLNGTSYIYTVRSNNTLTRVVQGEIFGFPSSTTTEGTWSFTNDEEDVIIDMEGEDAVTYNVQRLANDELWIKQISGSDTHIYYFDGQN
jgi:hypothetical protein